MSQPGAMFRRLVKSSLRRAGYEVVARRSGFHYVPDYYGRTAFKHIDIRELPVFGPIAARSIADGRTLLYYDRLYTIYQVLAGVVRLVEAGEIVNLAELGVYRGGGSRFIVSVAAALELTNVRFHGFDTFEGHSPQDVRTGLDVGHKPELFSDTSLESVREYLQDLPGVSLVKGRIQETAREVAGQRFQFVHLDVDLTDPTRFALDFFDPLLAIGGSIVVDDYGFDTCPGLKQTVDEFVAARKNYSATHLLSGQCLLVKFRESPPR